MDTSEEYIKMADCEEIQGQWKSKDGDVFFDEDLYKSAKKLKHKIKFDLSHKALGVVAKGNFICDHCNEETDLYPFDKFYPQDDVTWLPRQDQIQEMMIDFAMDESIYDWKCHTPTMKLFSLFVIFCEVNGAKYEAFEQLWLAFYMYEKHGKVWNGEKWMKNEEKIASENSR